MKRHVRPEELDLWARVAATVRPAAGRHVPPATTGAKTPKPASSRVSAQPTAALPQRAAPPPVKPFAAPDLEPGRLRRLSRSRDPLGPRLDLHGMDQAQARAVLGSFLRRAQDDGWRAVLVITGKGTRGEGVLRRMTPEWLAEPGLRDLVAGVSEAHRRHGGEGALYVALKRRPRA